MRRITPLLSIFVLAACGDEGHGPGADGVSSIQLQASTTTFAAIGESATIEATALDAEGSTVSPVSFSFASSDEDVVSVSASGTVTSVGNGTASVTATASGATASIEFTVQQVLADVSVRLAAARVVGIGKTTTVTATAEDSRGHPIDGIGFTFSSSQPSVATVDATGLITSVDFGRVNITATAESESGTAQLLVAPGLDYQVWHGGAPAGNWDQSNFQAYAATVSDLVTTFQKTSIYNKPVNPEMAAAVTATNPPDVVGGPIAGGLRDLVAQGLIADITDLWVEQGWDTKFPASIVEMSSVDGKRYFVPQAMQWNTIFYNKSLFTQLGLTVPTDWAGLLQLCTDASSQGAIPFTVSSTWTPPLARWFTLINLRLNGAAFHESLMRGDVSFTDTRVRAVFEHWLELFDAGCFESGSETNSYQTAVNQLVGGQAVMWNIGEWVYESTNSTQAANIDFFDFPVIDPAVETGEIVHTYGAFMVANADNPQQARDFLAYLGNATSQLSNATTVNRVVANLDVPLSTYNDVRQRGLQLIIDAPHATPLFEVATDPPLSSLGLTLMQQWWGNPSDTAIDGILTQLEAQRAASYD